jgi:type II secretory pathway pseudopilin PulG
MAIASTVLSGVMSLLFIPIVAAIAIPNLVASRQVANETSAIASLTVVLSAQATFHRTDFYGKGEPVYANPVDGNGFSDLFSIGGDTPSPKVIGLIDSSLAEAKIGSGTPKHGYYFADVTMSGDGNPFDHAIEFAICAVPAAYGRSGRNIYIMDVSGSIYMADAESIYQGLRSGDPVRPLDKYPTQDELSARWSMAGM